MSDIDTFFNAVNHGDVSVAAAYLAADPNAVTLRKDGATALHFAAIENRREIVDLLLEHGADLNAIDEEFGSTPAGWANERGHAGMTRYLHERGTGIDLNRASAFGLIDLVRELLIEDGSDINSSGGYGMPIHQAALWGHPEIVELLLENGADPGLPNSEGQTALAVALRQVQTNCGDTPIVIDARRAEIAAGCAKVIEILRRRGARE